MDRKVGHLLDETPGGPGGNQIVLAQYPPVGDAEILHQRLFGVVCDQADIHTMHPPH